MSNKKLGVAIIGCGNIARAYARDLASYPQIELLGVADLDYQRANELAAAYDCRAYPSNKDLLADDAVELVVNLTIHHAHTEVATQCLKAGKHVHSEKPLALTYEEAKGLVELAEREGLRLGCSPFTFMGEAQQTAWRQIKEGHLGTVRLAYAEVNWGRIEAWHPNPSPFYQVGVLFDVGVYPLTLLTAMFGPARKVSAYGRVLYADRVTKEGLPFHIDTPDFVVSAVELQNGPLVRLTTNFYVGHHGRQKGVEFHGDLGSLYLSSWQHFDAAVELAAFGQRYEPLPLVKEPYEGTEWGRGVLDMAQAIEQDRPHRATGEQAAHVVEILCAIAKSVELGGPVEVHSDFSSPAPMDWLGMRS
jgi:predicted dehydrogenase